MQMRQCNARNDCDTGQAHCGRVVHGKGVQGVAGLECNVNDFVDRECVGGSVHDHLVERIERLLRRV